MPGYNLSSHPITNYILPSHLVTDYCLASVTSQDGRLHHFSSLHFSSTLLSLLETEHRRNPRIHRLVVFKLYLKNDRTISPYQKKKDPSIYKRDNGYFNWSRDLPPTQGFPSGSASKEPTYQRRRCKRVGSIPGWRRSPGEEMATHSDTLA